MGLCILDINGVPVACKEMNVTGDWESLKQEIGVLATLNHPSIVRV